MFIGMFSEPLGILSIIFYPKLNLLKIMFLQNSLNSLYSRLLFGNIKTKMKQLHDSDFKVSFFLLVFCCAIPCLLSITFGFFEYIFFANFILHISFHY